MTTKLPRTLGDYRRKTRLAREAMRAFLVELSQSKRDLLFATLNPRERNVMERRCGLDDQPETLEAISRDVLGYRVSRERIGQIERHAHFKLRREARAQGMGDLLPAGEFLSL